MKMKMMITTHIAYVEKEIPSEPMIFCENRNCPRGKWFHLDCVNMSEDDIPDEKWYCCETCVKGAGKRVKKNRKEDSRTMFG